MSLRSGTGSKLNIITILSDHSAIQIIVMTSVHSIAHFYGDATTRAIQNQKKKIVLIIIIIIVFTGFSTRHSSIT